MPLALPGEPRPSDLGAQVPLGVRISDDRVLDQAVERSRGSWSGGGCSGRCTHSPPSSSSCQKRATSKCGRKVEPGCIRLLDGGLGWCLVPKNRNALLTVRRGGADI